jgi:hypothetical protein
LKAAIPDLPEAVLRLVLGEFDAGYELSEGVYMRIGSPADESHSPGSGFVPLVAPIEGFRLRKVQARRNARRIRNMVTGFAIYAGVVFLTLWSLVWLRGGAI